MTAVAAEPFAGRPGWTWYVPVRLSVRADLLHAAPLALRSAHASLLARAGGYVVMPESGARLETGAEVRVHPFSSGGAPVEA